MRRIERLINLIAALLETPRPMTAEDIRNEIHGYDEQPTHEAFRRAFERDKESLRAMGIPIEMKPVTPDPFSEHVEGYYIPKESYYLPELDLEPDEVTALRLAAEAVMGGDEAAASGLMKLSAEGPMPGWSGPRVMWGADRATEQALLAPIYNALLGRTPLKFNYSPLKGELGERTVEPYGLVYRRGNWYLVARDTAKDALRSFRLSRVDGATEPQEGTYEIPADFDAAAYLEGESFEIGDEAPSNAVVRFPAALTWWAEQNMAGAPITTRDDGSSEVEVPVSNADALVSWVLNAGPGVEVLSPPEMRAAVVHRLEAFLETH